MGAWVYPADLLDALAAFGLAPTPQSPPRFVRDALSDLYRYEIRRLRDRLLAREFPKDEYRDRVIALRRKYWPLTMEPRVWEEICQLG